ncbi:MAG: DegT/DnrJ/EryC1/StrS family aminotransferase [Armatimonadetes bacterium]|nr:DegT/DnrJ/EryC1/StrS family aminotransferase [Armatimonadota bacterium]
MKIDYYYEYPVDDRVKGVVMEVLQNRVHYAGKYSEGLEQGIADLCGVKHGVAANSGSSSLLMILHALGIGPGDEVIIPANTYVANAECVIVRGARPVFADCTADTMNLDPAAFEAAITPRTKAVIAVHKYGHPVDMDPIVAIARRRGIKVIENGCHALGALYKGRRVGSLGDCGFFALSHKLLSVCGMGGVTVTDDKRLATLVTQLRHHGRHGLHEHEYEMNCVGYNMRINEMQAAIGCVQLPLLDSWNAQRRENAAVYTRLIREAGLPVTPPVAKDYASHVYLHYVVRVKESRDRLLPFMNANGVEAKCHYPIPLHQQGPIVEAVGRQGPFPDAERACAEVMSLPCDPNMNEEKMRAVVDTMRRFFA